MARVCAWIAVAFVSFGGAAPAGAETPLSEKEQCQAGWKTMIPNLSDAEVTAICECIEKEKAHHPLDASKGSQLSGASGMNNAGPWPNIMQNCIFTNAPKPGDDPTAPRTDWKTTH